MDMDNQTSILTFLIRMLGGSGSQPANFGDGVAGQVRDTSLGWGEFGRRPSHSRCQGHARFGITSVMGDGDGIIRLSPSTCSCLVPGAENEEGDWHHHPSIVM